MNEKDPLRELNQPFDTAFKAEMEDWVFKLPQYQNGKEKPKHPNHPNPRNKLVGLAMSGGGTRSATFNLGVTQALAHYGLMSQVDYMSTVSGGGYLGASFTSLCADKFPYKNAEPNVRLQMGGKDFPYADQNRFAKPSSARASGLSPVVHGLETPATRHVRENSRLLIPGLGIFNREVWASLSRYAASTVLLWLFFLLPMVTAILLPLMLIPEDVWNRAAPFTGSAGDVKNFLGDQRWLVLTPLAMFGVSSLLAVVRMPTPMAPNSALKHLQTLSILGMVVSAAALVLVLGVWGYSKVVDLDSAKLTLAAVGAGSSGTALVALKALLNMPDGLRRRLLDVVFTVFGYFVLGLALVAWHHVLWMGWDVRCFEGDCWEGFIDFRDGPYGLTKFLVVAGGVAAVTVISWARTDWLLNKFSMNSIYEERIQRTWIVSPVAPPKDEGPRWQVNLRKVLVWPGNMAAKLASLFRRAEAILLDQKPSDIQGEDQDQGWTRVWERPDLKVGKLLEGRSPKTPYPLVCTALNLSGSTSPKLLNRRADSFVIGPVYTGSALTSWKETAKLHSFRNMPLARAAAISAAAFSPNMGRKTNRTLSIVTTLFNARLGWWARNPSDHNWFHRWFLPPSFLLYWMEMFGLASHNQPYVYLSDGGHFENTGIYELMRRRCKYIIAIDGTGEPPEDQPLNFDGLGVALRRVRIDFGVLVEMDLRPMLRDPKTGHVNSYFAVGRIRYPSMNGHGRGDPIDHRSGEPTDEDSGILIYIKGGIIEKSISPDLLNYHQGVNPDFPHDSTADQQFDEPQFESYRELGFLAGISVCNGKDVDANLPKWFANLDRFYQNVIKAIQ